MILALAFLLTGCAGPYARRNQIAIGMTREDIATICNQNPIYSCERLYEKNNVVTYRLFLLDAHRNLRPYKCGFSHDGVLVSVGLDQAYENTALENAAGFIRSQSEMEDSEPMYWSLHQR